jgi:hypothetical protein
MKRLTQQHNDESSAIAYAVVLDGVSERWQMNVLQILASPTRAKVTVEGRGTIDAPALVLTPTQARHLATQITEILGPEGSRRRT